MPEVRPAVIPVSRLLAVLAVLLLPLVAGVGTASAGHGMADIFGSPGDGNGQFQQAGPADVVQSSGDVWVQDPGANRVQRFNSDGTFDLLVGPSGAGSADLSFGFFATQVAVDQADGDLLVTDSGNARVVRFDSAGTFADEFGGPGDGDLSSPQGIAVAPDGSVYVADTFANRVVKFTAAGAVDSEVGEPGSGTGELMSPTRLAVDSTGRLYVLDTDPVSFLPRIQRFAADGSFDTVFAGSLNSPTQIAVDRSNDHVFAVASADDFSEQRVFELDSAGALVDTHGQGNAFAFSPYGVAVEDGGGPIYLPDGPNARVVVLDTPAAVAPEVTIDPVTTFDHDSATFSGTVDPNGQIATSYRFERSSDGGANWTPVPDGGDVSVGEGDDPVPVSEPVAGLEPSTTYQVRLVATKPFQPLVISPEESFTTVAIPPAVTAPGASAISDTGVRLRGRIDANNSPTSYRFEYGTDTSYGEEAPVPDGDAGGGGSDVLVSEVIGGLQPGTTYHYRLVATNEAGTTEGPDETFTTAAGPAPAPAGRGYEMVSPPQKNGSEVSPRFVRSQATPDGDGVTWISTAAFGDAQGAVLTTPYLSRRSSNGWTSKSIVPPIQATSANTPFPIYGFSTDLTQMFFAHKDPVLHPEAESGLQMLYRRDDTTGSFDVLTDYQGGSLPVNFSNDLISSFRGASADFSKVLFFSPLALTPGSPANPFAFTTYEWTAATGEVRHVGVLPDGTQAPASPGGIGGRPQLASDAFSSDGNRLFFTVTLGPAAGELYLREGTNTIHVSASQASTADPAGTQPVMFWTASEDGSRAFFTSCEKLTDDSTGAIDPTTSPSDCGQDNSASSSAANDLYRYEVATGDLVDLTTADASGARVQGVVEANDAGTRVYFVAEGVLASGAVAGEPNLYLWRDDGTPNGEVVFIGTLDPLDSETWGRDNGEISGGSPGNILTFFATERHSRVTSDGRFLAFQSVEGLTGHDTGGHSQVYLFDAEAPAATALSCASCDPGGDPGTARAQIRPRNAVRNGAGGLTMHLPRYLSSDGSRLFFDTAQALVPQDVNGKVDVYLYEDGRPRLITTGTADDDAQFVDASEDGDDVFFLTTESLVGWDVDGDRYDLYDARVDGGFPEPVVPDPDCRPGECQGDLDGGPDLSDPGVSGQGDGNLRAGERGRFRVAGVTARQRARLLRTGRLRVRVRVNRPGRVSVVARAVPRRRGARTVVVARGSRMARKAGAVEVVLRLSQRARKRLAQERPPALALTVGFSRAGEPRTLRLRLRHPARRAAATGRAGAISTTTMSGR